MHGRTFDALMTAAGPILTVVLSRRSVMAPQTKEPKVIIPAAWEDIDGKPPVGYGRLTARSELRVDRIA